MTLSDYIEPGRIFRMLLVLMFGILAIYVEASPLGLGPDAPPSPDLLLCVIVFWALRRPEATPMLLVFTIGIMRDLLTDVPVGAGALSLVLIAEVFKAYRRVLARTNFLYEWLAFATAAIAGTVFVWALVILTFAQPPYLTNLLHQCLYSAMIYPFIVLVMRWVLRIGWSRVEVPV